MCKSCRSLNCVVKDPVKCDQCNRMFKSKTCYDQHKKPVGNGKSVCQGIKKCEKCKKSLNVNCLDSEKHICGRKCTTCGMIINEKVLHTET